MLEKERNPLSCIPSSAPCCYGTFTEENKMSRKYIRFIAISRSTTELQKNRLIIFHLYKVNTFCASGVLAKTEVCLVLYLSVSSRVELSRLHLPVWLELPPLVCTVNWPSVLFLKFYSMIVSILLLQIPGVQSCWKQMLPTTL